MTPHPERKDPTEVEAQGPKRQRTAEKLRKKRDQGQHPGYGAIQSNQGRTRRRSNPQDTGTDQGGYPKQTKKDQGQETKTHTPQENLAKTEGKPNPAKHGGTEIRR